MSTLFNNNNAESGYRLRYMEVFNWGTFHGKIYKLQTDGKTSLLTGANGSGKTTLIDALLTLIVPGNKRFYNQSSGAETKKERDENSYFWGHFGKTFSDAEESSRIEQLRSKSDNPYSVLLACFQNAGTLHTITLVQIRWYSSGGLKKVFMVSPYQLNIEEHFGKGHFDLKGEWKKRLAKLFPKTDFFESFKDYAARFSDIFGLKEKALSLFNQTVGIKVLGDLTTFIRQQMLEEPDAEEQFKSLYNHYNDLLLSHKAIQKDERQLALLEPVMINKQNLLQLNQQLRTLNFTQQQLPLFLGKIEYDLLEMHLQKAEKETEAARKEQQLLKVEIEQIETEKEQLIVQKAALNIDNQIQLLKKDIASETEKRNAKKETDSNYQKLAHRLNLQTDINEASFKENQVQITQLHQDLREQNQTLSEQRFQYRNEKANLDTKITQLQEEIDSFLTRKNRIQSDLIAARNKLLELLGVGEGELPFVGQLIKVKESELYWEDAIERVLHNFARLLLVPDQYQKQVNHFVHHNDLRTKLVYEKIDRRRGESLRWLDDGNLLFNKLELKEADIYSDWIDQQLRERFDYYCTDDLDVLYNSKKAITANGLIRNVNRHEKDDRPGHWNKRKYTLGWDNKETVRLLQQEKHNLQQEHTVVAGKLQGIAPQIKAIEDKIPLLTLLADVHSYYELNWQQHAEKITSLTHQVEALEGSSDQYKTISEQLTAISDLLVKKRGNYDSYTKKVERLERESEQKEQQKALIRFDELMEDGITTVQDFANSEQVILTGVASLDILDSSKKTLHVRLKIKIDNTINDRQELEKDTIAAIGVFVNPPEKILTEFPDWSGDVLNIPARLDSLDELEDLYKKVRHQRLVEHKRRFRDYMDKSMLDALTNFRTWLYNEEDKIKEVIEELNVPLKQITFNKNPDTYLQLEHRATKEHEIKLFKEQLSATIPNTIEFATQKDEAYREAVFEKIKSLISELQKEETWRKKVTDARNWLNFGAREYTVADNKVEQYHDNTASYSGGQKAQFTYAVLGAAIAHQFGIFQTGRQYKSLRFITVDEAFSKLDPEKSQFLMEFCAQLNLQILVVTPLDKINIAEPYINAVHFVEIKNKRHSMVYNLTMEEYYERKDEFNLLADKQDDYSAGIT
jgi:uncharacterized protein YPO0396